MFLETADLVRHFIDLRSSSGLQDEEEAEVGFSIVAAEATIAAAKAASGARAILSRNSGSMNQGNQSELGDFDHEEANVARDSRRSTPEEGRTERDFHRNKRVRRRSVSVTGKLVCLKILF